MEQSSSSSKVKVEYYDPYGVYQLLSPGLLPRLPLRNLHWESHAGPLRSISSLHVDLVPATQETPPATDIVSPSSTDLSRVKSQDSTASGDDGFRTQNLGQAAAERPESSSGLPKRLKSRRHQIPGLRQTPYLKVFFLRCDDNETYKLQARKQVREWVKEHAPPVPNSSKVSSQENHDAFEWLIVHVIVPNTAAATQPRTGGKSADGSSGSATEKSRWRGGSSSTLLEKLRADFNGTSKSAIDRVAQIRIGINDVPYDMLPRVIPAIPGSYSETQQENTNAWLDLITKFKSLILSSFDMRVGQYEEDIREKDTQRTLPGWNFCTFFVLKEGLARGFESVGLVEDALVVYDELSVGLDSVIREQRIRIRVGAGPQHGGSFLPFTEELKRQAERARATILSEMGTVDSSDGEEPIDLQSSSEPADRDADEIPLSIQKKRYRDLILANDVSVFDFRCYIFARQLSLLLRLANATSSQEELLAKLREQRESSLRGVAARLPASQPSDDTENLTILGEICRRAMDFVSSIARIMREEIWAARVQNQQGADLTKEQLRSDPITTQVMDNIVSSFTFAVTQQILAQTSTKALPIPPSTLAPPSSTLSLDGQEQKTSIPEPKTMMHPARTSSLALRSSSREPPSPGLFPGGPKSSLQEQQAASTFLKTGLEELAAHRAELYILSRRVLEQAGKRRGWSTGWAEIANLKGDNADGMEEVDLSDESQEGDEDLDEQPEVPASTHGIESKLLKTALEEKDDFYRLYETLTDKALRHFTVASRMQSVHSSMADLAILNYHLTDYAAAASYFFQITSLYGEDGWAQVELSMLVMYAKCLRELQRKDDYIRVAINLLSKAALAENERLQQKSVRNNFAIGRPDPAESAHTEPYVSDLLEMTKAMKNEWVIPLQTFFGHVEVDGTPRYHPEQDTFTIQVRLQFLLADEMEIEKAKIRIVKVGGESSNRDIWLETAGPSILKKGVVNLNLHGNVIIPGKYVVNYVGLYNGNVALQYEHGSAGASPRTDRFFRCPKLLIYQRVESFDAQLYASRYMHLDRTRYLEIGLSSGWNDVTNGDLNIRVATAGLRLQTSEIAVVYGSLELPKKPEAGIIYFGDMEAGSSVRLRLPFNLEQEVNDIVLRLEISYTTEKGTFFFSKTLSISVMLPLGVNVQDVFKHKALFSKFTISSATSSPLRLLGSRLESSDVFTAEGGTLALPIVIFPRQPASMLYKITKSPPGTKSQPTSQKGIKSSLSLVLNYLCIEEEIEIAITQELAKALSDTALHRYTRLVLPTVTSEIRARLNPYDLERIAVLGEVSTSILSSIKWRDHFSGLGRMNEGNEEIAVLLADRLQAWQKETPTVALLPISVDENTISESRSIVIPVDVPAVTVVHTADLRLLENMSLGTSSTVVALNQPISASLDLEWTKRWDSTAEFKNKGSDQSEYLEFFYEVSGPAETWLIGGRRKGHFRIPTDPLEQNSSEKLSFPVMLIPLREGFHQFPSVEIKSIPAKSAQPGTAGSEGNKQLVVTCETDFKNTGETIRVISDTRKTTLSLDASGPQGGAWLLETERRTLGNGGPVSG